MAYVDGFVLAVVRAKLDRYREVARLAGEVWKEHGALSYVECVGDDVPDGTLTSFPRAVQAKEDEVVVFSWREYPSKEAYDAANERMMSDPRMKEMGANMPFDGQRMIFGGFEPFVDQSSGDRGGYVDGFVLPVREENREAYRALAQKAAGIFQEHGATRVVEAWGDDVPDGKVTDYKRAVKAEDGENVVFSWIEWPSKEARVAGWEKVMADERMKPDPDQMPFDGQRMFWGGFSPIVDA